MANLFKWLLLPAVLWMGLPLADLPKAEAARVWVGYGYYGHAGYYPHYRSYYGSYYRSYYRPYYAYRYGAWAPPAYYVPAPVRVRVYRGPVIAVPAPLLAPCPQPYYQVWE